MILFIHLFVYYHFYNFSHLFSYLSNSILHCLHSWGIDMLRILPMPYYLTLVFFVNYLKKLEVSLIFLVGMLSSLTSILILHAHTVIFEKIVFLVFFGISLYVLLGIRILLIFDFVKLLVLKPVIDDRLFLCEVFRPVLRIILIKCWFSLEWPVVLNQMKGKWYYKAGMIAAWPLTFVPLLLKS